MGTPHRLLQIKCLKTFGSFHSFYPLFQRRKWFTLSGMRQLLCWSNYRNYFISSGLGYSCDLTDVVSYYKLYEQLMKTWKSIYGDKIFDLDYDLLTIDQDNQTRKLIRHLGLDFEMSCMRPNENERPIKTISQSQVQGEVYPGSSRTWRRYHRYLNGAFDSL